jgi:hypothetical protein
MYSNFEYKPALHKFNTSMIDCILGIAMSLAESLCHRDFVEISKYSFLAKSHNGTP